MDQLIDFVILMFRQILGSQKTSSTEKNGISYTVVDSLVYQSYNRTRSSVVTPARPSVSSSLQISHQPLF